MKGGAYPSPFAALSFPNSKKIPIDSWVDRDFSSCRMAKPSLKLPLYGDFLHHKQASLTTLRRYLDLHEIKIEELINRSDTSELKSNESYALTSYNMTPVILETPDCKGICIKELTSLSICSFHESLNSGALRKAIIIYNNTTCKVKPVVWAYPSKGHKVAAKFR